MGPPNKILLPDDLDRELGDLRRRVRALETAGASPLKLMYPESVDAAHPFYLDLPLENGIKLATCKLSWKLRLYRTTSAFAGGASGAGSAHGHGAHAHNHGHNMALAAGWTGVNPIDIAGAGGPLRPGLGVAITDTTTIVNDTTNATPNNESAHTHSIGASSLGISEGAATTIAALLVDGVDKTSLLGGPWAGDIVDLEVAAVMPSGDGLWHTIQLTPAGQGRIVAILKFG